MKVQDIMTNQVVTVSKETTIEEVARKLVDHHITGIPVIDQNDHVIGVISEKDLIYKDVDPSMPSTMEYLGGIIFLTAVDNYHEELKKLTATKAEQMMNTEVTAVSPDDTVKEVGRMMIDQGIYSVPVIKDGKLVGMVSSRDIIKTLLH